MQQFIFNYPKLKYGYNPPAIYKMTFDTGHFYIGSSGKIKTRFNLWRTNLKRHDFESKVIYDVLPLVKKISFEIIEVVPKEKLLLKETEYIQANISNDKCLNRRTNPAANIGIKPLPLHLIKPRKPKKEYVYSYTRKGRFTPPDDFVWDGSKAVYQFTLKGEFIKKYKSIQSAANYIGVNSSTISDHVKSNRVKGVSGYVFRTEDNMNFTVITKKNKIKPMLDIGGRPVIDTNTGVFYYSVRELAELLCVKDKWLYKRLNGDAANKTQYRYA